MAETIGQAIRVGLIGVGGMGTGSHLRAYLESPLATVVAVCDAVPERARQVAAANRIDHATDDYRSILARADVDAVAIVTPNDSHAEISLAALAAGKHVMCEKPIALTVDDARAMERAAAASGLHDAVNFGHRYVPAARYVKQLLDEGALGEIRHVNIQYSQGWLNDPTFPRVWRLQRSVAGTGVLGDLGTHLIDLTRWWLGQEIVEVSGRLTTFQNERPLPATPAAVMPPIGGTTGRVAGPSALVPVDVDDEATWLATFAGGAQGVFFSSRNATGRSNFIRLELYGVDGGLVYENSTRDSIEVSLGGAMWKRNAWARLPVPPTLLREERSAIRDAIDDIVHDRREAPSFHDGVRAQEVIAAVEQSALERRWQAVDMAPTPERVATPA